MARRLSPVLAAFALMLAAAPAGQAGGPGMLLGAAEDAVRTPDLVSARIKMGLLSLAGFGAVRVTSQWQPGLVAPTADELAVLAAVDGSAKLTGLRLIVLVHHAKPATTPLTDEANDEFAQYVTAILQSFTSVQDVIVGYEPNSRRFWRPQFNADRTSGAAPAYLALLSRVYDSVKLVSPAVRVWGGALAARGNDRPFSLREGHSPGRFLEELGAAYRAGGRTLPVMDGLAVHPHANTSSESPDTPHTESTTVGLADYDRLLASLAAAFDGTPQPGSTLPILYDEFGVEAVVPAGKARLYNGNEQASVKPVSETTQAAYYAKALQLAFCQANVAGLFLFHPQDERARRAWQSGVLYADGTPKTSFWAVRDGLRRTQGGSISRCAGMALDVQASQVAFPTQAAFRSGTRDVTFRCTLDCAWELRAVRASGAAAATVRGYGKVGEVIVASLARRRLGTAPVSLVLTLTHPVNPGVPWTVQSATALAVT
jgi:hypothetical protein